MNKKIKKILSTGFIVGIAAATAVLSGMNHEDEQTLKERELASSPYSIEVQYDPPKPDFILEYEKEEHQAAIRTRSRSWSFISVLFWILAHLLGGLLKPFLRPILTAILIALLFFAILCFCLKVIYPDTPLKELLTKRNILLYLCFTGVFIAALNVPEIVNLSSENHNLFTLFGGSVSVLAMVLLCSKENDKMTKENK